MTKLRNWLIVIIAALTIGAALGWWFSRPKPITEQPAAEQRQPDGSLVLERSATAEQSSAVAAIPKGGKVERNISVTVKPHDTPTENAGNGIKVDLALVRMPDDTRRVVASSPDGEVVGGLDVPVDSTNVSRSSTWSAGLSYDPIKQTPGIWIERDLGRLRLGAEVAQTRLHIGGETALETRVRVGWVF